MYAVDLILKNGTKIEGLIWHWAPKEGICEVMDETTGKIKKHQFKNIQEGVFYSDRVRHISQTQDLLEKAITEGWVAS
jgi:virulence-associated protein VapD